MSNTAKVRPVLLSAWANPSSQSERERQERAERMVKEAIDKHPAFVGTDYSVYTKGSYANNTNVRLDSDVDIAVENRDLFYFDYNCDAPNPDPNNSPYRGNWTPDLWRREVIQALVNHFGASEINTTGRTAIKIAERSNSRPSADVVPCFQYKRFDSPDRSIAHVGTKVYKTDDTTAINYPDQQLRNGREKNIDTGGSYKRLVRVLKGVENELASKGTITEKPSYLMECMGWNVPNAVLTQYSGLDDTVQNSLRWLLTELDAGRAKDEWEEPSRLMWLFRGTNPWTPQDAYDVASGAWSYLGY